MRRANLGAGGVRAEGWISVDRAGDGLDYTLDMRNGLPFETGELDYAVCHHVLDAFEPDGLYRFLGECRRVLKVGGVLRVSAADIGRAIAAAERRDARWFQMIPGNAPVADKLAAFVFGQQRKTVLTQPITERILSDVGFLVARYAEKTACPDPAICDLDSRWGESFFCEGIR